MPVYGLIGNPLGHTFSKKYFTEKFQQLGLTGYNYENFELADISAFEQLLKTTPDLRGINVTIPFKQQVLPFLDVETSLVRECKACNCIKIEDGKLTGFNTDVFGFVNSFVEFLSREHNKALVLGTGGSSNAVCAGLKQLNIPFLKVSRSGVGEDVISYAEITSTIVEAYTIIINCTPLGSLPLKDQAPQIPYHLVSSRHYFFDLIYNPSKTKFLSLGEQRGARIKNGHDMLVLQAEESWRIWNATGEVIPTQ